MKSATIGLLLGSIGFLATGCLTESVNATGDAGTKARTNTNSGAPPGTGGTAVNDCTGLVNSGDVDTSADDASSNLPTLHVDGTAICDSGNNRVVLRGAATIDVGSPNNWNNVTGNVQQVETSIDLVTGAGWKTNVVRLPVYGSGSTRAGQPNNFPEAGPVSAQDSWFDTVLKPAVDYATSKNLYAIIDWHEVASATARDAATQDFWTYMAPKLKNRSNILYEVFNEDSDTNQWTAWLPLAQGWVNIIRGAGANNIVLVGGPSWAQTIGDSATNPITGGNIGYVSHIYCTHYNNAWSKGYIENQVARAAAAAPVFITEWGYGASDKDPGGYIAWMKNLSSNYGASWTAWVISPTWGPPMFNSDRSLTSFGQSVKDWLAQY